MENSLRQWKRNVLKRIKHWAGFPIESIKYCLREAGVGIEEIDHIARESQSEG